MTKTVLPNGFLFFNHKIPHSETIDNYFGVAAWMMPAPKGNRRGANEEAKAEETKVEETPNEESKEENSQA